MAQSTSISGKSTQSVWSNYKQFHSAHVQKPPVTCVRARHVNIIGTVRKDGISGLKLRQNTRESRGPI